jgi:predicted secreted protein
VPKGLSHYETHRNLIIDNEFVSQEKLRVKIEADLNFETRTLTLVITGIDPQTGWIQADPFLGFLYPNDETQRGTGSLSYIVRPKAGLADETKITNKAIIFFDWNELIETNEVFNTIGELKQSPLIIVTEPDGINDKANTAFTITWTDKAPENDALISIYYDTNSSGEDGTLIVSNIEAEAETNHYTWDTSALPEGDYYLYAVIDDGVHAPVIDYSEGAVTIRHEPKLLVELSSFAAMLTKGEVWLNWETQTERDSQGFRIWRAIENSAGGYTNVTLLGALSTSQAACVEGQLIAATGMGSQTQSITARGHSTAGACYAFQDISLFEKGTYYYVLEEVDMSGQSTFHCNDLDAVTIGFGPAIDLTTAKRFCRQATGSKE